MGLRDRVPLRSVGFGSCQERKMFPTHCAPNRMGNEFSRQGDPHRGPGCYDNHVIGTIMHDVQMRPLSKKGYTLAARTASRFLPSVQAIAPPPQKYQQDRRWPQVYPLCITPFNSTTQRFRTRSLTADSNPGPGTYAHDTTVNRKVSWPMRFGSPDWSRLPQQERKALRTQLLCDKKLAKQRTRVAYLQLFYS
ncbi:protein pitchfork isoform X2 [Esox lucius]|uniref:Protein pitchfork n=1 Tax=Esox lucius TaxID=8010 RepID=A0A3P8XKN0_ESOLU|nr:protein pitchfork isoform X2 [Esox lucius]